MVPAAWSMVLLRDGGTQCCLLPLWATELARRPMSGAPGGQRGQAQRNGAIGMCGDGAAVAPRKRDLRLLYVVRGGAAGNAQGFIVLHHGEGGPVPRPAGNLGGKGNERH